MEQKRYKDQGMVLKRVDYGEADRIITFLTQSNGKVSALVRGVRKPKSKLAGGIELFSVSELVFLSGKGELDHVISSRIDTYYKNLLHDYERMQLAYKAIELVDKHTETDAPSDFFDLLNQVFGELNNLQVDTSIAGVWLYLRLLRLLGRQPDLFQDSEGNKLKEEGTYTFDGDEGVFKDAGSTGNYNSQHIKTWRLMLAKKPSELINVSGLSEAARDSQMHLEYMLA
jgi:DNA repair protein RecO (recombination protein O)